MSSPAWFDDFHSPYAVLTEQDLEHMQKAPEYLPTAGLCVRKAAWDRLIQNGFRFQLTGSVGKKLQGGEDTELTIALRLSGWQLRIDRDCRCSISCPASASMDILAQITAQLRRVLGFFSTLI